MTTSAPSLFGSYLAVDWSSNGTKKTGKDSIWLALVRSGAPTIVENPATRSSAIRRIEDLITTESRLGRRVIAGFDFPFGYPKGFTDVLEPGGDWRDVWGAVAA